MITMTINRTRAKKAAGKYKLVLTLQREKCIARTVFWYSTLAEAVNDSTRLLSTLNLKHTFGIGE